MKNYTMKEINAMTKNWLNGNDEKSKRAWKRLLKEVNNES